MPAQSVLDVMRRGYVLIVVLLLLLAVTGVGHTLLVMTRSEFFVSRARWEALTRRLAAEAGQKSTARVTSGADSLPLGSWVPMGSAPVPPRARDDASVVRLSPEVFLILAEGSLEGEPGRDRRVGLYWAMDPVSRFLAASGIVESGGPVHAEAGSMVDPSQLHDTPGPWREESCMPFRPGLDTPPVHAPLPRGELDEDPRAESGDGLGSGRVEPRLPSLGLLGHDALVAGADLRVPGTVSPAPIHRLGRCEVTSPTNWGAPLDAADPCAAYKPVTASEGSLIVNGGQGQGVLLISGDATFRGSARYYGLVVVAGDLQIIGESEIHGLVRVRGEVLLGGRSRIVGSACAALSALDAAQRLRELTPIPQSAWPDSH